MRDDSIFDSEDQVTGSATRPWRGRMATAFGAAISLVILITVIVWSYRLGVRDADDVPVIRAEATTTKIRPEEPGGLEVAHQDRTVYDVVSGEGDAAQTEPETALAPPPQELAPEDKAPLSRSPNPGVRPARQAPESGDDVGDGAASSAENATPPAEEDEIDAAVAAALAQGGVAGETSSSDAAAEAASVAAPGASPTPPQRPSRRPARPAGSSTQDAASSSEAKSEAARAAARTSRIQIQLGAFESEAVAAAQWSEIKARNRDLLTGRGRVIMPVTSGGKQLFRLRAGPFDTVAEASTLCRGLAARNQACIVARAR